MPQPAGDHTPKPIPPGALTTTEREYSLEQLRQHTGVGRDPVDRIDDTPIRVLDLFSGPGGVGVALKQLFATFNIDATFIGVDTTNYGSTYPGLFYQRDATDITLDTFGLDEPVDLVWASPLCKPYSKLSHIHHDDPKDVYPTIPELGIRELVQRLGREYIIENVPTCDDLRQPIELHGERFGLGIHFPRAFETSFGCPGYVVDDRAGDPRSETDARTATSNRRELASAKGLPEAAEWDETEAVSAIPPAYVAYLLSYCPTFPRISPPWSDETDAYRYSSGAAGQPTLSRFGKGE